MGSTEVMPQCTNVLMLFISLFSLICILLGFCWVLMSQGGLNVVAEAAGSEIQASAVSFQRYCFQNLIYTVKKLQCIDSSLYFFHSMVDRLTEAVLVCLCERDDESCKNNVTRKSRNDWKEDTSLTHKKY